MIKVFSRGIEQIENLNVFLDEEVKANKLYVVGWGHKPTATKTIRFAKENDLPYLSIEDGFLRSVGLGSKDVSPLSLIVEHKGCYYDATCPSETEDLINSYQLWYTENLRDRASDFVTRLIDNDLSKYNIEKTVPEDYLEKTFSLKTRKERLLLVDQTRDDSSVLKGMADAQSFERMLADAMSRADQCEIFVKRHPETKAGVKRGYLEKLPDGVHEIDELITPFSLLKQIDEVYTVTSQLGFDALLCGKKVHVYGTPFYSGWGLTEDHGSATGRRKGTPPVLALAAVIYLQLARYVNPISQQRFDDEEAVDFICNERNILRQNDRDFVAAGFRRWKRPFISNYFKGVNKEVVFNLDYKKALLHSEKTGSTLLVWGEKCPQQVLQQAKDLSIPFIRVGDGFIRSVGLGTEFNFPYSLVADNNGMYYDPQSSSDLFEIIKDIRLSPDYQHLIKRSAQLRNLIVQNRLSKYNLSAKEQYRIEIPKGKTVCLVVGQVEDDVSFTKGGSGSGIRSNLDLLKKVRFLRPEAFIIYKPHPDVVAKNRIGNIDKNEVKKFADLTVSEVSLSDLLDQIDELHTLSSLSGFEALLRGITVHTYGIPFYAGWSLTVDHAPIEGRGIQLTLDELVAATLILYPRYFDWKTKRFCRPEDICYRMSKGEQQEVGLWIHFCRFLRSCNRKLRWAS